MACPWPAPEPTSISEHLIAMKVFLVLCLLSVSPVVAQTISERSGLNTMLDRPPTATDVLLELHQFDLFEQNVTDSADKRGDDALRKYAVAKSDAANKRDDQLNALQKNAGLTVDFPNEPSATRSNRLGGLDGSVGPGYANKFYEAQVAENQIIMSVLTRYLAKPDNDAVKNFANQQLPVFEKELVSAQTILGVQK